MPADTPSTPPKTLVLGYLATGGMTPPRVRRIAYAGVLICSLLCLVAGVLWLLSFAWNVYQSAQQMAHWRGGPMSRYVMTALEYEIDDLPWDSSRGHLGSLLDALHVSALFPLLLPPFFIITGTILLIFAGAVRRGVPPACHVARASILSLLALTLLASTLLTSIGVFFGFGEYAGPYDSFLLLPAGLGVFLTLVLKDLAACLAWIARHPLEDKPPAKFLEMPLSVRSTQGERP